MAEEWGIQFYPLDFSYRMLNGIPAVLIFARTVDGKKICLVDEGMLPYFYVIPGHKDLIPKIERLRIEDSADGTHVVSTELAEMKHNGQQRTVIKVNCSNPAGLAKIASIISGWDMVEGILEHDVSYVRKYLNARSLTPMCLAEGMVSPMAMRMRVPVFRMSAVEQVSDEAVGDLDVMGIDIETYYPDTGIVDPKKNPIIMLALYTKDFHRVITWKRFDTDSRFIEFVESESEVISRFVELIEQHRPDILVGYNSAGFDLPYIRTRARKYRIELGLGLDHSEMIVDKKSLKARIKGIVHVDSLLLLRRLIGQFMSVYDYRIENVVRVLLNETKPNIEIKDISEAWDNPTPDLVRYCESNLMDARLAYLLFDYLKNNLTELVRMTGVQPYSAARMTLSNATESYLIREMMSRHELIPNKPSREDVRERRRELPEQAPARLKANGLFPNLALFDLRGLLADILAVNNLSIDTLNCSCCDPGSSDLWFCKRRKGAMPKIIETLKDRAKRIEGLKEHDNPVLHARLRVLEMIRYSIARYLEDPGTRWHSRAVLLALYDHASIERQRIETELEAIGLGVQHSAYNLLLATGVDADSILKIAELESIDPPRHVRKGLFMGSRNPIFALLMSNNQVLTNNLPVRSNLSLIAKEAQKRAIEIILTRDKVELLNYVTHLFSSIRNKVLDNERFLIHTTIQKPVEDYDSNTPYVAAAKRLIASGRKVSPGTTIHYLIAEGEGKVSERVRLPGEAQRGGYDPDYYINKQVLPQLRVIFDALGIDINSYVADAGQSRLDGFFTGTG